MRTPFFWLLAGGALAPLISLAAAPALAAPASVGAEPFRFHADHVLGTSLDVVAVAADEPSALIAFAAVRQEIARLDPLLSAWRPAGGVATLNRSGAAKVSPELFDVLSRCEAWRGGTGGAFDCRVGAALALWRDASGQGRAVDAAGLQHAVLAGRSELVLDRANGMVRLGAGAQLTVDGLAKGYVIDAALAAARAASPGLQGLMVDIGGDLRCWGREPTGDGWRVGVAAPGETADNATACATLRLTSGAVAASGRGLRDLTTPQGLQPETLSPATGRPVKAVTHAVVTAPCAADADALATACMAMTPDRALALANALDGVEARITDADGVTHASRGWDDLLAPVGEARLIRAGYAAPAAAQQAAALDVAYQVPRIEAEPYHAPYVVMWVTDQNRQLVRTLLVLGAKPKWAPENYVWWRRYGRLTPQVLDTVARPTRPPGRYTAKWDGLDEAGKPAAAGRYILHIEAAREKGGHTYQTAEFDLGGAAGAKGLPAKDEMGAVELRFGPGT